MTRPYVNFFDDDIDTDQQQRDLLQRIQWTSSRSESDSNIEPDPLNILRDPRVKTPTNTFQIPRDDIGVLATIGDYAGGLFTGPAKAANAALSGVLNIPDALVQGAFGEINHFRTTYGGKAPLTPPDLSVNAPQIPVTPRTTTGGRVIEGVAQFIAGWTAIGKLGVLAKVPAAGAAIPSIGELSFGAMTAGYRQLVLRGAATDAFFFAGQEENMANLVQHVPLLQNPITEYLADKTEGAEVENRLKNAVTGVFAGMAIDGMAKTIGLVVQGVKHFKQTRALQRELDETAEASNRVLEDDIARIASQKTDEQIRALVGDPNAPPVQVRSAAENKAVVEAQRGDVAYAPGARQRLSAEHSSTATEGMPVAPLQNIRISENLERLRPTYTTQTAEGSIRHPVSFDTTIDQLAYVATSRTKGTVRTEAIETLKQAGWDDEQISRIGTAIREDFATKTKDASTPVRLRVEPTGQRIFGEQAEDFFQAPSHTVASAITRVPFGKGKFLDFNFAPFRFAPSMEDGFKTMVSTFQKSPEVRTWLHDAAKAGELNQLQELYKRTPDQILASDEMIGLAALTKASWMRTSAFAGLVRQPNATDAVRQEFAAAMVMHTFISNQWSKAGTEAGRALAARRRVVSDAETLQQFRNMQASLATVKGAENIEAIADAILHGARSGDIVPATKMLEQLEQSRWDQKVLNTAREIWTNFILSGPKTFITNAMSPIAVASYTLGTRALGRVIGDTADAATRVEAGELAASMYGMWRAVPEAWEAARKMFIEGGFETRHSMLGSRNTTEMMKNNMMQRRVSADYWNLPTWSEVTARDGNLADSAKGMLGSGMNYFGSAINSVYKTQSATDAFWKVAIYRSELHALGHREAMAELRAGKISEDMFEARLNQLIDPNNIPTDRIQRAAESARRLTFTEDPGKFTQKLMNIRDMEGTLPNPLFFIIPFINTPANILKYTFQQMPGLNLMSQRVRDNLAAGGPEAHIEYAKMGMGSLMLMNGLDMYYKGNISGRGPTNSGERQALQRTGWQPYSIKIGDTWYQYNRFEPMGMLFGIVADVGEIAIRARDEGEQKDALEMAGAFSLAVTNTILNKTYFSGLFEFVNAVSDPTRYGDSWLHKFAGSMLSPGLFNAVRRVVDPEMAEVANSAEAVANRFYSANLPVRRDLWGREMRYDKGVTRFNPMMPFEMSHGGDPEPIDTEMIQQRFFFDMPSKQFALPTRPNFRVNLDQERDAYSRYVELAGNEWRHPSYAMGAKELLNSIVGGTHPTLSAVYNRLSDGKNGEKHRMIRSIITEYREGARMQLLKEYPWLIDQAVAISDQR